MNKPHPQTSLLHADNKDLKDLFLSVPGVFTARRLRQLAFARGIVLSHKDAREELIEYLSLLSFSKTDLDVLLDEAAPAERQAASEMCSFDISSNVDAIFDAVKKVGDNRRLANAEDPRFERRGDAIIATVRFTELDPTRNRLRQKRDKEIVIELRQADGHLEVRATPGNRSDSYVESIVGLLATDPKKPPDRIEIDLSGISNPAHRTEFFIGILNNVKGGRPNEVTDVRVNRMEDRPSKEELDDADDLDSNVVNRHPEAATKLTNVLRNASLEGSNLLSTAIYRDLQREGYFMTKAVWLRSEKSGAEVCLEAWFSDAPNARGFRYRIKSVADEHSPGDAAHHRPPTAAEKDRFLGEIEAAARESLSRIHAKVSTELGGAELSSAESAAK